MGTPRATGPSTLVLLAGGPMSNLVRRLALIGLFSALVAVGTGLVALRRVLHPATTSPESADAVVYFAGGGGERLARSLQLMEAGVAPTLVLSIGSGRSEARAWYAALCDGLPAYEIVCVVPSPETTQGEAAIVGRLAAERGWRSLAVVTSDYHLDRAAYHVGRCFDGVVHPVAAPTRRRRHLVRHELVGFVHARTVGRGCPSGGTVLPDARQRRR